MSARHLVAAGLTPRNCPGCGAPAGISIQNVGGTRGLRLYRVVCSCGVRTEQAEDLADAVYDWNTLPGGAVEQTQELPL